MKVCIATLSQFHMFDLARQVDRFGCLRKLYSGYPACRVRGVSRDKMGALPWPAIPGMFANRFGPDWLRHTLGVSALASFDNWVADRLLPCDVFHALSGFGLRSHIAARQRYGALTVCDRGSSHIVFQDELLRDEYAHWGVPYSGIDRRIIERELSEYESCDRIIVPSLFSYRSFIEKGVPEHKLRRNPYGVDLAAFQPLPKTDAVFRVIYVGGLSLRKGVPYLLEALCPLRLPNFELCLAGPLTPELRPLMARFEGKYRYLGTVAKTELLHHYSQSSVFVLPSVEDGFGLVLGQAMACGLPVIATTNTGAEDLCANGAEGFIVPIRSAAAIRERVVQLYENPELRDQMGVAALRRVHVLGGWDNYGAQTIRNYEEALATNRGAAGVAMA
ncbi:MAG: glycosyltransferase family 4 protein [Candidatus Binataceae bacterium]